MLSTLRLPGRIVLLAAALATATAAQTPDTTTAARYVPLAVGNEWHYAETTIRTGQPSEATEWRYRVTGHDAEGFGVEGLRRRSVGSGAPTETTFAERWRHDPATGRLVGAFEAVGRTAATCSLDTPFDSQGPCTNGLFYDVDGGYDEWVVAGPDSVATSRKAFDGYAVGGGCVQVLIGADYGAGVGEAAYYSIVNDPCSGTFERTLRALRYVHTDEVTLGTPLFPVDSEAAPDAALVLSPPAPNPLAGRAAVSFQLARPAALRLDVVDALGRTVAVLAEGPRAAGPHRVEVDASGLAPGIYVLRLATDGAVAAERFTVLR